MAALADWAAANPGRFTYPAPPDFHGTTFLKQVLHALVDDPAILQTPPDDAGFGASADALLTWLDALHPNLWRAGAAFPQNEAAMRQLLDDGEIDIGFSFNPGAASAAIEQGLLPETVRSFVLDGGTIGNTHFVAIPFNANAPEAAMVVANFLLSPEAQLRKQYPALWGDPTVLDLGKLSPGDRASFDAQPRGIATLAPEALGPVLPEPHPDWMIRIEAAWRERYGS
jgi:putative thiamine transport system substrate-binding protein